MKKLRAAAFFGGAAVVLSLVLLIPTPLRVKGTLVLTPAKPERVYVSTPGQLVSIDVRDHDPVKGGEDATILAKLINLELLREVAEREQDVNLNNAKAYTYEMTSSGNPMNHDLAERHKQMVVEDLDPALEKVADQVGKLTLFAGRDGVVIGVPHREQTGKWMKAGDLFCEIGDPKKLEAHLLIDQSDVELIAPAILGHRAKAWVKIQGKSAVTIHSQVEEIARKSRDEIPPELSNLAGGEIATKPNQETGQAVPLTAVFEAIIPVDNSDLTLQPGQRGIAKIDGGTATLGWWLWRLLNKTFRFTL